MSVEFSSQKLSASSSPHLSKPLGRTYLQKQIDPVFSLAPRDTVSEFGSPGPSEGAEDRLQETLQRQRVLPAKLEKPTKDTLARAFSHYARHQSQPPEMVAKTPFEKLASWFVSKPDPNVYKLNELHTLYATAVHVCGQSLRQIVSEEDMQAILEQSWKTGKVNAQTLALYETSIVSVVKDTLGIGDVSAL